MEELHEPAATGGGDEGSGGSVSHQRLRMKDKEAEIRLDRALRDATTRSSQAAPASQGCSGETWASVPPRRQAILAVGGGRFCGGGGCVKNI